MTDEKDTTEKKTLSLSNTLSVKKPEDGAEKIRQSFAHGRSKTVTFEVKRRRTDKSGVSEGKKNIPAGLSEAEWDARLKAVQGALQNASEDEAQLQKDRDARTAFDTLRRNDLDERHRKPAANVPELTVPDELPADKTQIEIAVIENETPTPSVPTAVPLTSNPMAASAGEVVNPRYGSDGRLTKRAGTEDDEDDDSAGKAKKNVRAAPVRAKPAPAPIDRSRHRHIPYQAGGESDDDGSSDNARRFGGRRFKSREKPKKYTAVDTRPIFRDVIIPETIVIQELASRMAVRGAEVVKKLMGMGMMLTVNQPIDGDTAELIALDLGHTVKRVSSSDVELGLTGDVDLDVHLMARPPVVTVMGHVDHGKTSLLDAIRQSDVVSREAGGITQHIGAYQVQVSSGAKISFIDTPGHAAFTEMRSRGANVTDIVVLVVAADDGIMPQTIEAIHHAKAAGVPIIVAINKIDKPDANPERVRTMLLNHEVVLEEVGGDVMSVEVSAKKKLNIDKLEEMILLQAEMLNLRANPDRSAQGVVVEAKLDKGRGPVATVLIQNGTLKVGDIYVSGFAVGRVRALVDERGRTLESAGPSQPVEVLGYDRAPHPGDDFIVMDSEGRAREIAAYRIQKQKEKVAVLSRKPSLEQLLAASARGEKKELAVVIKSDVQGSLEAIVSSLAKFDGDEVGVRVLHAAVGAITESDVTLAKASRGFVIGFNVRPGAMARDMANRDGVEMRYYSIIYDVIDDVKAALGGMLSPTLRENYLGAASIRQVFNITKVGKVAGCHITNGTVKRGAKVRLLRDNVVIHEGTLKTLKRMKDEVKEVRENFECGMAFERYDDIREGDVIECFEIEEIARTLA